MYTPDMLPYNIIYQ